jgi:hypothetical protein
MKGYAGKGKGLLKLWRIAVPASARYSVFGSDNL